MKRFSSYFHCLTVALIILMLAGLCPFLGYASAPRAVLTPVSDIETEHTDANFYIRFHLDLSGVKVKSEHQLTVTPMLKGSDKCIALPGAIVAGHNRYLRHLRQKSVPEGYSLFRSGRAPSSLPVDVRLPFEEWMLNAQIVLKDTVSGCSCRPLGSAQFDVASVDMDVKENVTDARGVAFAPEFVFVAPVVEVEKIRQAKGQAFIDFPISKTVIYRNYRRNPEELANIKDTISMISNDPDYRITSITLKGFASPEGPYAENEYLAKERTFAIRNYIGEFYDFSPSIMHVSWEAEDWQGLADWLRKSSIQNRDALLWIATTSKYDGDPDRREWILKTSYPEQYRWLLANVYPALRHTDYTIEYSIRTFTAAEEILAAWRDDPRKMSLNELYALAVSYPVGSREAIEVFETAAALYPHSDVANLNAGVAALQNEELQRAERYLKKAGDSPEALYAKGILAAKMENFGEALILFRSAAAAGLAEADDAAVQIRDIAE